MNSFIIKCANRMSDTCNRVRGTPDDEPREYLCEIMPGDHLSLPMKTQSSLPRSRFFHTALFRRKALSWPLQIPPELDNYTLNEDRCSTITPDRPSISTVGAHYGPFFSHTLMLHSSIARLVASAHRCLCRLGMEGDCSDMQ